MVEFGNKHGNIIDGLPTTPKPPAPEREPEPEPEMTIIDEAPSRVPEDGLQQSSERLEEHLSETPVIVGEQATAPVEPEPVVATTIPEPEQEPRAIPKEAKPYATPDGTIEHIHKPEKVAESVPKVKPKHNKSPKKKNNHGKKKSRHGR